jgi:hypothetical protein
MHGWRNPHLTHRDADAIDWPAIVATFEPWRPTPAEAEAIAAEEARGDCIHWRGTREATCAAGVNLRGLVGGPDPGWATRLPCRASLRRRANGPVATCPQFRTQTEAEREAEVRETEEMIARYKKLGPLWQRIKREHKGKTAWGVETCPVCGGKLHWSHSRHNGHLWTKCETDGCVDVIE